NQTDGVHALRVGLHLAVPHYHHGARDIAPLTDQSAVNHTLTAGSHRSLCTSEPPLAASQQASSFFGIDISQHRVVEHLFSQELLQLGVLILKRTQSLRIRRFHATILRFVFVERRRTEPVPSTHVSGLLTRFLLFDHPYDLFVCKSCLHLSVLFWGGLYTNLEDF
ncbi:hypothetical protein N9777_03585, partial [Ascidiaceihabitans sp.]|nr:hypothetical protein [Ascidiaceihabitans sp.]